MTTTLSSLQRVGYSPETANYLATLPSRWASAFIDGQPDHATFRTQGILDIAAAGEVLVEFKPLRSRLTSTTGGDAVVRRFLHRALEHRLTSGTGFERPFGPLLSRAFRYAGVRKSIAETLWGLREDAVEADEGITPPSREALLQAILLLDATRKCLPNQDLPRATASDDGYGGVYIYWWKPEKRVQLRVPQDPQTAAVTVYQRSALGSDVRESPSPSDLAATLEWFTQE